MLYTKKGDDGMTGTFRCDQRISKSSNIAEALGAMDEINSLLGLVKVRAGDILGDTEDTVRGDVLPFIKPTFIHSIQQSLFVIQAELAGAEKTIDEARVKELEEAVDSIEKTLPPIKTFFISGGTELAATFDFARTVARRAERRVVAVHEEGSVKMGQHSLSYMNRLSSVLYALARYANNIAGVSEEAPKY